MTNSSKLKTDQNAPILLGGGPLGLGDPDDKRLRKSEKDIIIQKKLREEAKKKCFDVLQKFLDCSKDTGLLNVFKCRKENTTQLKCVAQWMKNEELINSVTNQYLQERSYYRRTGKQLKSQEPN